MTVDSTDQQTVPNHTLRDALSELRSSLRAVFANPALRRMQVALAGSMVGDWAYAIAVAVWAYEVGGASAVGIWGAIKFVLMAFTSPIGSYLADRLPRKRVLIVSDLLRALVVLAATACLFLDTPPWPVFVLGTLAALIGCVFRPTQMSWMPSLTDRPDELTASNGVSSTLESLAFFIGPALGASLIAVTNVETVFLVNVATFLFSAWMVTRIHPLHEADSTKVTPSDDDGDSAEDHRVLTEMAAGFTTIRSDRNLVMIAIIVSAQTIVAGAMLVFGVVLAVEVLRTGAAGVGYIDSVFGIGAIAGGFFAIARASRNHLASDLAVGTVLWCMPLFLIVAWPSPVTVFAASIAMGFGNPLVDTNFVTLVQRITPHQVLGRVFGALEAMIIAGMAIGSAVMPFLISGLGLRWGMAIIATVVAVPAFAFLPRFRTLDTTLREPEGTSLLRAIPMFAPLTRGTVEGLAGRLRHESAPAGTTILSKGEESDRFLVIVSGAVEVTDEGRVLRTEGPGDYFGEIGLLRDVPRTATVTAVEDTELLSLSRSDFLEAVTGEESLRAADEIVSRRLG